MKSIKLFNFSFIRNTSKFYYGCRIIIILSFILYPDSVYPQFYQNRIVSAHLDSFENLINRVSQYQTPSNNQSNTFVIADSVDQIFFYGWHYVFWGEMDYFEFYYYNREYKHYNSSGRLNQTVITEVNKYGVPESNEEIIKYNSDELVIEHIKTRLLNYQGIYTFDTTRFKYYHEKCKYENKQITERYGEKYLETEVQTTIEKYYYNNQQQLEIYTHKNFQNEFDSICYYYNNSGLLEYELSMNNNKYKACKYTYEDSGDTLRIKKEAVIIFSSDELLLDSIDTWANSIVHMEVYDNKDRLISYSKKTLSGNNSDIEDYDYEIDFEYNNYDQLLNANYIIFSDDGSQNIIRLKNTYNEHQNIACSVIESNDDEFRNDSKHKYSDTKIYYYSNHTVGIAKKIKPSFKIYPNPSTSIVNIECKTNSSINIYSADGKLMDSFISYNSLQSINVSNYKPGMYFVCIANNSIQYSEKLIIKD